MSPLVSASLIAIALGLGIWALARRAAGSDRSDASRLVGADVLHARIEELRRDVGRLEDDRELQRGVFEVSSELVGCVDEDDARRRFAAALRRYWDCASADLLVWEQGTWRSLGGPATGANPVLDHAVTLPGGEGEDDLVIDLSAGVAGRAALILRKARPQPSLVGRTPAEQRAVAETLRAQLTLSLRRVMLYGELQALARVDPLTTTHRRWYGESRLKELVDAGEVVAVAMVDIDRFKAVNDGHGHAAGDQVLAAVGRALVSCLRGNDLVCRWGGEEFLVILPGTPPDGAKLVAERLRAAVESLVGMPVRTTVSVGLASCAQDDTHFDLVARADEALYVAKRDGRNRVAVAGAEAGTQVRLTSRLTRRRDGTKTDVQIALT